MDKEQIKCEDCKHCDFNEEYSYCQIDDIPVFNAILHECEDFECKE